LRDVTKKIERPTQHKKAGKKIKKMQAHKKNTKTPP